MDTRELVIKLLSKVQEGDYTDFQLIRNYKDYLSLQTARRVVSTMVGRLYRSASKNLRLYCRAIRNGSAEVSKLLVYKGIYIAAEFYERESTVMGDIIYEYACYLSAGHKREALDGVERTGDTLVDYREATT